MKQLFQRVSSDIRMYGWAAAAFGVYYFSVHAFAAAFCPVVALTGFPCPGCGMVRAVLCVAGGELLRAYYLNPSVYVWLLAAAWIGYHRYIRGHNVPGLGLVIGGAAALMVLSYVYRLITVYPRYAPMVYTGGNLLSELFVQYEEILRSLHLIG